MCKFASQRCTSIKGWIEVLITQTNCIYLFLIEWFEGAAISMTTMGELSSEKFKYLDNY